MKEDKQSLSSDDDNKLSSTHDELLERINYIGKEFWLRINTNDFELTNTGDVIQALRAVVELHKPYGEFCSTCAFELRTIILGFPIEHLHTTPYPCPTIQAIEAELK